MKRDLDELRARCRSLPQAEEYLIVHHPAFRVGKRPFVILDLPPGTIAVNLGRMEQEQLLREDARFQRTPYMGHHGWVSFQSRQFPWSEIWEMVLENWRRLAPKRLLR